MHTLHPQLLSFFLCCVFIFNIFPDVFAHETQPLTVRVSRDTSKRASPYHTTIQPYNHTDLTSHREKRDTYTYTKYPIHIHIHTRRRCVSSLFRCYLRLRLCVLLRVSLQVPLAGACLMLGAWCLLGTAHALVLVPLLCRFSPAYPYPYTGPA